jgi:hypothetical protein
MRDICVKKPGRKIKDPLTVHVMGDLSALMSGKAPPQLNMVIPATLPFQYKLEKR